MKILVTGALGHIGSHLIRKLPKAFPESEIILIDSLLTQRFASLFDLPSIKSFKFFNADIREFNFNNILDNDSYIINLAAITDAAIKLVVTFNLSMGSSPPKKLTYPAKTDPATVAIPPIITVYISE